MLVTVYAVTIFTYFLSVLFARFHIKYTLSAPYVS